MLKQVVAQATAHFGRCFGTPRKPPQHAQSLILPFPSAPTTELPENNTFIDPAPQSTLTNQWRDIEQAQESRMRSAHRRRRRARDRRHYQPKVPAAPEHVFSATHHFAGTVRLSAHANVKLAMEDQRLHQELRRKVRLDNTSPGSMICGLRAQSVSPFPNRIRHQSLNPLDNPDLEAERTLERVLSTYGSSREGISRKPQLSRLLPLRNHSQQLTSAEKCKALSVTQPMMHAATRKPAVPRCPLMRPLMKGKCYLGLEDDTDDDDLGLASWFMTSS